MVNSEKFFQIRGKLFSPKGLPVGMRKMKNQHLQSTNQPREVKLSISDQNAKSSHSECEVTEFDAEEGWQQWQDSVFVQDFEDSVLSAPAPLFDEGDAALSQT
jgi:hypothetical protein